MAQPTDVRQILDIQNRDEALPKKKDDKLKEKKKRPGKIIFSCTLINIF